MAYLLLSCKLILLILIEVVEVVVLWFLRITFHSMRVLSKSLRKNRKTTTLTT